MKGKAAGVCAAFRLKAFIGYETSGNVTKKEVVLRLLSSSRSKSFVGCLDEHNNTNHGRVMRLDQRNPPKKNIPVGVMMMVRDTTVLECVQTGLKRLFYEVQLHLKSMQRYGIKAL